MAVARQPSGPYTWLLPLSAPRATCLAPFYPHMLVVRLLALSSIVCRLVTVIIINHFLPVLGLPYQASPSHQPIISDHSICEPDLLPSGRSLISRRQVTQPRSLSFCFLSYHTSSPSCLSSLTSSYPVSSVSTSSPKHSTRSIPNGEQGASRKLLLVLTIL